MSRGSYVWRGFCPEGFLSAHRADLLKVGLMTQIYVYPSNGCCLSAFLSRSVELFLF